MGRGALGRKAEGIDRGEQLPASGILLPQLLGFVLDLLRSRVFLRDQADGKAADRLGGTKAIQPEGAKASLGQQLR